MTIGISGHGAYVPRLRLSRKALQSSVSDGWEMPSSRWDGSYMHTARIAAKKAYAEAGIARTREQISMTEVHDSGIRMLSEMYLQLLGRAGPRQVPNPKTGPIHKLGGQPSQNVCSVSIAGLEDA